MADTESIGKKVFKQLLEFGVDAGLFTLISRLHGRPANQEEKADRKRAAASVAEGLTGILDRKKKDDEVIYSSLVNKLETDLQANLGELMRSQLMQANGNVDEFQFSIALMDRIKGEENALRVLRNIAEQSTLGEAFAKVKAEGLIKPESSEQRQSLKSMAEALKSFSKDAGKKLEEIEAEMERDFGPAENSHARGFRDRMKTRYELHANRR